MDQRREMVAAYGGEFTVSELAERYGVSRKTIYKWLERYDPLESASLADRSRAPRSCPHRTPEDVREAVVEMRRAHPHWGPRKLLAVLRRRREDLIARLPAPSTAGDILKREGMVPSRRRRLRAPQPLTSRLSAAAPNEVWCADHKGEFKIGDGQWCYPLTITDAYSRYLLLCDGLGSTSTAEAMPAMERLFREVGLPDAIRTDNGCPFGATSFCGLSQLSVWWTKLGIAHQRIRPGVPQDNATHERMHRTLKAETARPPAASMRSQQARFDAFRGEYNHERPHESLAMQPPATVWRPPVRTMPEHLPEPEYAGHMLVRSVRSDGSVKFKGRLLFLSQVLVGEHVAFEEIDDGIWTIYFFHSPVGRYNECKSRITPMPSPR